MVFCIADENSGECMSIICGINRCDLIVLGVTWVVGLRDLKPQV